MRHQQLVQIRRIYTASCAGISLVIQNDDNQWTLEVRSSANPERIYQAHRSSASAARKAAADYLWFHSPDAAPKIAWRECW
jgi:hypothetical protein